MPLPPALQQLAACQPTTCASFKNVQRTSTAALPTIAAAAATNDFDLAAEVDKTEEISEEDLQPVLGRAFMATLRMLEWGKVCASLASFASTTVGKRRCLALSIPPTQTASERLLAATRAATTLEFDFATSMDFGGIQTEEAEAGLLRADKGGMLTAAQLRAVVALITGALTAPRALCLAHASVYLYFLMRTVHCMCQRQG